MNIVETLGLKFKTFHFEYFGINDWATQADIKLLIDKESEIKEYYKTQISKIETIDEYIDCLFLEKYSKFEELKNYINDDVKDKFSDMLVFINNCKNNIKPAYYISFINKKYEEIFNNENYTLKKQTFSIIFQYYSGFNKLIEFCIKNYFYMVLDNLQTIQNVLTNNSNYIDILLEKSNFETIKSYRLNKYFELIKLLKMKNISAEKIDYAINYIVDYGREVNNLINEDNAIQYDHIIKAIAEFLKEIKSSFADEFLKYCESLDATMHLYLEKHGHSFSYSIPYKELIKPLEENSTPVFVKLLLLTHVFESGKPKSYHENIMQSKSQSLIDHICTTSTPYDDYFTITKQQALTIYDQTFLTFLKYYICEDRIAEFIEMLKSLLTSICTISNIDYEMNNFETDLNIILNGFIQLFRVDKEKNEYAFISSNYGLTMFIIGLIEKFLREFYKSQNTNNYVDLDYCTLGDLLSEQNPIMVKFLGLDNIKVFNYYLTRGNKFESGLNLRNNYAHYKNLKPENIRFGVTLKSIQIFLMILNILNLYYEEEIVKGEKND